MRVINVSYLKKTGLTDCMVLQKKKFKCNTLGTLRPPANSSQEETSDRIQKKPDIHEMNKNPCP